MSSASPYETVSATTVTAVYNTAIGTLSLHAEGEETWVGPPEFLEEPWLGHLKFRLAGVFLGFPPHGIHPKPTPYTADYQIKYHVPAVGDYVLVQTKGDLKKVPIEFFGGVGPEEPPTEDITKIIEILPVITLAIEGPFSNYINAVVPPKKDDAKSEVRIEVNHKFVRIVSTYAEDGIIRWVVAWEPDNYPTGEGESPQHIRVITTKLWRVGADVYSSQVIQPYQVHFANLPIGNGKNVPLNTKTV